MDSTNIIDALFMRIQNLPDAERDFISNLAHRMEIGQVTCLSEAKIQRLQRLYKAYCGKMVKAVVLN